MEEGTKKSPLSTKWKACKMYYKCPKQENVDCEQEE